MLERLGAGHGPTGEVMKKGRGVREAEFDRVVTDPRADTERGGQIVHRDPGRQRESDGRLSPVTPAESVRRARRHNLPGHDDRDRIGEGLGLVHVVGSEHHRAAFGTEPADQGPGFAAGRRVESGGGLVEKDELRIPDQGQAQIEPTLLASRERLDPCPSLGLQTHQIDHFAHRPGVRIETGALGDRLGHGQKGVHRTGLENNADLRS